MSHPCQDCTAHNEILDKISKMATDGTERITLVEASAKSAHHRIDELKKHTESIIRLSMSVEHLAEVIAENILPGMSDHGTRITNIERRPGEMALRTWKIIGITAITAFLTGIVGYSLAALFDKEVASACLSNLI